MTGWAPATGSAEPEPGAAVRRRDLRTPVLGVVAWAGALLGLLVPPGLNVLVWSVALGALTLGRLVRHGGPRWGPAPAVWVLVLVCVGAGALLRVESVRTGPVTLLSADRASVRATVRVSGDPVLRAGRFGDYVLVRAQVESLSSRGRSWHEVRRPVLLLAPTSWRRTTLGARVATSGRLGPSSSRDLAGVLLVRGPPQVVDEPAVPLRVAERVRAGIRAAVGLDGSGPGQSGAARALVPALVDGDDAQVPDDVQADFRLAGLTHLLAVSGTNLTLVVGALLVLARWCGVRARGLLLVGVLGVAAFVLLARPEPSVLRAAAMGSVALVGMGGNGRERGVRALGAAVLGLLLVDPWLARDLGFALSTAATAGILFLAPVWRDRLARWLPRWAAEAVAVPLAAQLACTPLVAAVSGQVSLVAVPANLLAAPAVAPATVCGLFGGVLSALWTPLGRPVGLVAVACAGWIVEVAHRAAALPTAVVGWPLTWVSLVVLTVLCLVLAALLGPVLARLRWAVAAVVVLVAVLLVPVPTPGWPPRGWVLAACDVGQGDGLVLSVSPGTAVVVDTGPVPALMDSCLRRLGVHHVALVILTHFHADHVDGLAGVLRKRQVDAIEVTTLDEPAYGAAEVDQLARQHRVPVRIARLGERVAVGPVSWQVLAPDGPVPADSASPPNDASIVMLVRSHGLRLLLTGDEETGSQERLAEVLQGQRVDVLKVAHHGSSKQDHDLVVGLHPRLAVISVGVDNVYGHPAGRTLALLREAGAVVRRTDTDGDVVVVADPRSGLRMATRMPAVRPKPGGVG